MTIEPPGTHDESDDGPARRAVQADNTESAAQQPAETQTVQDRIPTAGIPKRVGHYHIKRVLGSGGMGTVYEATQEKPRRIVALKLMKQGIASRSALRRFEYESQILARLRHPGIAQVYEAGMHRDDRGTVPFFAMEYIVAAKPITKYVKEKKLGTRERMKLFASVCDAVHHGHQKGIIHRDLKPSNILVDASGQVKIIDFGVARSTDSDMAVTTLQTDIGQLIGTLQYMSPEQCEADPHNIDTRSDVYALGMVFFELLTDQLPYDVTRVAMHEATRIIREQQPTRLSTLNKTLRGDIETIALKALEKDRERRYQSATDFGQDIQRYLSNEAIAARPPSIVYQVRIFARRNKTLVASVAMVFFVLATGVVVSTALYLRAERALVEAERQAAIAQAVNDFLNDDLLASVAPDKAKGKEVTVREVLDTAAQKIEGRFTDQPSVEAQLRQTIGWVYYSLGRYARARQHLERALTLCRAVYGNQTLEEAQTLESLAFVYAAVDPDNRRSCELALEVLRIRQRLLGPDDALTLRIRGDLAMFEALGRGENAAGLNDLTLGMMARIRNQGETLAQMREAINKHLLDVERQWASGDREGAIARIMAEAQPVLAVPLLAERVPLAGSAYAMRLNEEGVFPNAAEAMATAAVELGTTRLGEGHPNTIFAIESLGIIRREHGRYEEARPLLAKALDLCRRVLGDDDQQTLISIHNMGGVLRDLGQSEEAEALGAEAVRGARKSLSKGNWLTGVFLAGYGKTLAQLERYADAEAALLEAHEILATALGPEHERTIKTIRSRVDLYDAWDAAEPGKGYAEKAAQWRVKLPAENSE